LVNVDPRFTRGEEARRRKAVALTAGEGGDSARVEFGGECARVEDEFVLLTDRTAPLEVIRDFGDGGEAAGRAWGDTECVVLWGDVEGDLPCFGAGGEVALVMCRLEVAWCLRLGGAEAMTLALARLAAMAAATLLFLLFLGVTGGKSAVACGFGHALSSCFRATESRDSNMTVPRSGHTPWKTQKQARALSLTPGLGSAKAFLNDLSRVSTPPEASMTCFER
jgi:hypothetical protein